MTSKPVFEHRHYKRIAAVISSAVAEARARRLPVEPMLSLRQHLADEFEKDNPRFDRERFIAAASGAPSNGRDKVRS